MSPILVNARVDDGLLTVEIDGDGRRQQVEYRLDLMLPFSRSTPHLLEFFEFMLALYAADRLVPRPARAWSRPFHVVFPVSRPAHWSIARNDIEELIWSSTGDTVVLETVRRPSNSLHRDLRQTPLALEHESRTTVMLLSDGLDSLCGAFAALTESAETVAFVSIVTNSRKASRVTSVAEDLGRRYGNRAAFHRIRDLHLVASPRPQERTQRTRTMLAISAGLTVAAAYGSSTVSVCENGIGLLNLPVPTIQTRHESSQVLHPQNLRLWSRVSEAIIGGATVSYPNRFRTKAEMLADIPADALHLISCTTSCDAPQRMDQFDNCGVCGSCVFRKLALRTAGLSAYDTTYTMRPPQRRLYDPSDLLRLQALRLDAALHSPDPWRSLLTLQPTLRTAIEGGDAHARAHTVAATLDLLRRHIDEVALQRRLANAV